LKTLCFYLRNVSYITDIKRALLTFDKVYLSHPDDREIIPRSLHMAFLSPFPIPISGDLGPVRPLGKTPYYDKYFERVLEEAKPAIAQESLIVLDSPESTKPGLSIGSIPIPKGWPNPSLVFRAYRGISMISEHVEAAGRGLDDLSLLGLDDLNEIAPNCREDGTIDFSRDGKQCKGFRPLHYIPAS